MVSTADVPSITSDSTNICQRKIHKAHSTNAEGKLGEIVSYVKNGVLAKFDVLGAQVTVPTHAFIPVS